MIGKPKIPRAGSSCISFCHASFAGPVTGKFVYLSIIWFSLMIRFRWQHHRCSEDVLIGIRSLKGWYYYSRSILKRIKIPKGWHKNMSSLRDLHTIFNDVSILISSLRDSIIFRTVVVTTPATAGEDCFLYLLMYQIYYSGFAWGYITTAPCWAKFLLWKILQLHSY